MADKIKIFEHKGSKTDLEDAVNQFMEKGVEVKGIYVGHRTYITNMEIYHIIVHYAEREKQ